VAVRVSEGSLWYQAHTKNSGWLSQISGYDINDYYKGYAGNGEEIDALRVYYITPKAILDKTGNYLKAKYRVGTGNSITDTADGCIAYPISIKYGIIKGPGINEVLNSNYYYYHLGCDKLMVGMIIPLWDRVLEVVTKAANMIPQIRYIGWDIAITNNSVEIIEGNHNPYHGTFEIMGTERLWWPKLKAMI
jgi:hypothetical protein